MKNIIRNRSLAADILLIVTAGPIILASLFLPNAPQILKPLIKWHKNWGKIKRQRIYEAIRRLNRKRLIELTQRSDKLYIEITENGKRLIKNFDYDNIKLPSYKKWDKKWRLVIFDIPDDKKDKRDILRNKLDSLGFIKLQESVYVHPFDCLKEISLIKNIYNIYPYVQYIVAERIETEINLLEKFYDQGILQEKKI